MSDDLEYIRRKLQYEGGWEGLYDYLGGTIDTPDTALNDAFFMFARELETLRAEWDRVEETLPSDWG
jgi:hypothetical protein